jgi:hypothetical protein
MTLREDIEQWQNNLKKFEEKFKQVWLLSNQLYNYPMWSLFNTLSNYHRYQLRALLLRIEVIFNELQIEMKLLINQLKMIEEKFGTATIQNLNDERSPQLGYDNSINPNLISSPAQVFLSDNEGGIATIQNLSDERSPHQHTDLSTTNNHFSTVANNSKENNPIENWAEDFPRRPTPTYDQRHQFQIRHCGDKEIRIKGGGAEIWADGINFQTGELLEAKFIETPKSSPFINNSQIPPFIRAKIVGEIENEFRRYAAIINDSDTPVVGLQVIVNIAEAVPFFEGLIQKFNIPGMVVTRN